MHLSVVKARLDGCKECHDLDNSPDFLEVGGFDKYWPKVKHGRPAAEKIKDVLASIADGNRPIQDLALIQDWIPDLSTQSPTQVPLVEQTIKAIVAAPANAKAIILSTLQKLEVE